MKDGIEQPGNRIRPVCRYAWLLGGHVLCHAVRGALQTCKLPKPQQGIIGYMQRATSPILQLCFFPKAFRKQIE